MRSLLLLIFLAVCESSFAQQVVVSYPVVVVPAQQVIYQPVVAYETVVTQQIRYVPVVENVSVYRPAPYGYWVREVPILPWRDRWRYVPYNY